MKPLIGITANFIKDSHFGEEAHIGGPGQLIDIRIVADDYIAAISLAGGFQSFFRSYRIQRRPVCTWIGWMESFFLVGVTSPLFAWTGYGSGGRRNLCRAGRAGDGLNACCI